MPRTSKRRFGRWALLLCGMALFVVMCAALFVFWSDIEQYLLGILDAASTRPALTVAVVVALMIAHNVLPIPAEVIAVAAGAALGPYVGGVAVWCGAMLGAVLAYWVARAWGREVTLRLLPQRYASKLDAMAGYRNWAALLGVRLIPVISFNLVNYSAGLAAVSWRTFLWTTAVGIVPIIGISTAMGANMHVVKAEYLLIGAVVLGVVAIIRHVLRRTPS